MKKILSFLVVLLFTGILFAESYKVESVKGQIFRLDGLGNQIKVEKDETLEPETILKIGLNSELTLSCKDVKAFSKVPEHVISTEAWFSKNKTVKGKIKKATIAKTSSVAPAAEKSRQGVATAASRASEAKEDFTWDE